MSLLDELRAAGFSQDEIGAHLGAERRKLLSAGFGDDEIQSELGIGPFREGPLRLYLSGNSSARAGAELNGQKEKSSLALSVEGDGQKHGLPTGVAARIADVVDDFAVTLSMGKEAAEFGFQGSVAGLLDRRKLPEQPLRDLNVYERAMAGLGQLTGDIPAMFAGALATSGGGPITASAGAFALPAGLRKVLMDAYEKGEIGSFQEFMERSLGVAWETVKGGLTGAAVGRAGQVFQGAARLPAEIATLVTVSSSLEGRIPEPEEFIDAAILIGGVKFAVGGAAKLREVYEKTGKRPSDVLRDIEERPSIKDDLLAQKTIKAYAPIIEEQTRADVARLDEGLSGLRSALNDTGKFEELRKNRPEFKDIGSVLKEVENLENIRADILGERRPQSEFQAFETAGRLGVQDGLTEARFSMPIKNNVKSAAEELLLRGDVRLDPNRLVKDQVMELLQTNRIGGEEFKNTLKRHGVTVDEFSNMWGVDTTKAARELNLLSQLRAKAKQLYGMATPEELEILRQSGMDYEAHAQGFWRRLNNVWRGSLTSQLSTAVRNFETQVARVGIDVLQKGLDAGLQRLIPDAPRNAHPADGFAAVLRIFQRDKTAKMADEILSLFPKEHQDLYMRYSSDLNRAGAGTDAMSKAERVVEIANWANRFQEYAIRNAVFISELDVSLRGKGKNLQTIISENKVGAIDRADIKTAIDKALEITWGKDFSPFAKGPEGVAGKFIQFINSVPFVTNAAVPFPRFMMNALKFQFEFSPLGFLKLLSKDERAAIAKGDTQTISRALIGTGMLLTAMQFRDSEYAGEKFYEFRLPGGKIIDMRPFNPFVSYLFVADVVNRSQGGTLSSLTVKDIAMGLLSTNIRAGAGLYIVDNIIENFAGIDTSEKGLQAGKSLAGSVLSGFLVPIQQLRDVYSDLSDWLGSGQESIIRDTKDAPFAGPFLEKIPFAARDFPAVESPTREDPIRRIMPTMKQATGLMLKEPKNPAERELDRLGFTRGEISPSTGNPEADRLINKNLGPMAEKVASVFVQTDFYQEATNEVKGGLLREVMLGLRHQAVNAARQENPELMAKIHLEGLPRRRRLMLESLTGGPLQ